jgi:hypothetical protein
MRKRRPEAKLFHQLDDGQQAQLAEWLLDGMPYHKARELIAKPPPDGFGLKVGLSAFQSFWESVCVPLLLARRSRAVKAAEAITEQAITGVQVSDEALIDALKQKALEVCMQTAPSGEEISFLMGQVLKVRDQDLKQRELSLKREKFEFDAAKACLKKLPSLKAIASDRTMGEPEKLEAIRKHLFGEVPTEGPIQ